MTWLVWRQHRAEAVTAAIVVAVLAIAVTPVALHLYDVVGQIRQESCLGASPGPDCGSSIRAFNAVSSALAGLLPWLNFLPGLAGVFIGAPLVAREIEDGTWRLAWSQGVTRPAWLRGQLLGTLAVIAVSAALFTAVATWLLSPVDYVNGRFEGNGFDFTGVVPLGWSIFAFGLGVLAGTVIRRVIPAMAVTLVGYLAIRLPDEFLLRPRYLPAAKLWGSAYGSSPLPRDAWNLSQDPVAPGGHTVLTGAQFDQVQHTAWAQLKVPPGHEANLLPDLGQWLTAHGYTQVITYQPADRFWAFQGIEAGGCLLLAAAALALSYRLVLRRYP
jgi:hypothetical protein